MWVGSGAARLGLAGEVDAEALGRILEHVDPSGVYRLTASRSVPVIAAYDATFCAPKSVSLLHALGPCRGVHRGATPTTPRSPASLPVLEQVACRLRRGRGGHTVIEGDGFVAAAFRHRTSRAGDPHLHTHVVTANLAQAASDGRWTALDGRPLYAWLRPVGHLYEAHLRWELTRRLGVEWGPVRNGIADIVGSRGPCCGSSRRGARRSRRTWTSTASTVPGPPSTQPTPPERPRTPASTPKVWCPPGQHGRKRWASTGRRLRRCSTAPLGLNLRRLAARRRRGCTGGWPAPTA